MRNAGPGAGATAGDQQGHPTAGLLAHVMVAKFADYLPLYRKEKIFSRAGLAILRSTLAQWVCQTGVQLQPLVDAIQAPRVAMPVKRRYKCCSQGRRNAPRLRLGLRYYAFSRPYRPCFTTSAPTVPTNIRYMRIQYSDTFKGDSGRRLPLCLVPRRASEAFGRMAGLGNHHQMIFLLMGFRPQLIY